MRNGYYYKINLKNKKNKTLHYGCTRLGELTKRSNYGYEELENIRIHEKLIKQIKRYVERWYL